MQYLEHTGKLDLACGDNKREGFFGIDKFQTASTDAVVDLLKFPWPIADNSVDEVVCCMFFEHIPKELRPRFMEELCRVMKVGATAQIITPLGERLFQDYTHEWPPVVPSSYVYFNKKWREENKLTHGAYDLKCDFLCTFGYALDPEVASWKADQQQFAVKFHQNAATDLYVTCKKLGAE